MADEIQHISEAQSTPIQFEDILPWNDGAGDTGLSARLKLKRNFEKIKAWIDMLDISALVGDKYLSKTDDDTAEGFITFAKGFLSQQLAIFEQGLQSPDFVSGLFEGKGWGILPDGTAQFPNLKVQQMQVLDLIVNRLNAIDGDQVLAENDIVESVEQLLDQDNNPTGVYRLHLEDKWDGYFTAQAEGNILMGVFNALPAYAKGLSDVTDAPESDGVNPYFTSWTRVVGVNAVPGNNYVDVVMWPDDRCPANVNFEPCRRMKVVRRGNVDATNHADRQNVILLSSTSGRIMMLTHVDQPIIEEYMYGYVMGNVPEFVKTNPKVAQYLESGRNYLFIDGIICNQIIEAEKKAAPSITYVQYEEWDPTGETFYHFRTPNGETDEWGNQIIEQSDVWHGAIMWRCLVDGTTEEPRWNSTAWQQMTGMRMMAIEFRDADDNVLKFISAVPGHVDLTIVPHLMHGETDISADIPDGDWSWMRTTRSGEGLDASWNREHAGMRAIHITDADMPNVWNRHNPVILRCQVHVRPGEQPVTRDVKFG